MKTFCLSFCATLLCFFYLLSMPALALGYEEIEVKSGGTLTGKVTLNGTPPPARIFHLITSPNMEFCGKISDGKGNRLLEEFTVAENGGFGHVLVLIVGVQKGKPFTYTPEINIENCRISPFVSAVRNDHPINLINHDPIVHDIQSYSLKDDYTFAMFNKPMVPNASEVKQVKFRPNHYLFRIQCGVHAFMQMWGMAVGNPYFAVTEKDGSFSISDIPPGEYDVIAWHPLMNVLVHHISIQPNGKVSDSFEFDTKKVIIPIHDLQKGYRFDTALKPSNIPKPTVLSQE